MHPSARPVYLLGVVFAIAAPAAVAVPRLLAPSAPDAGFAAAASAAGSFFIVGGLATIVAIILFVRVLRLRSQLPPGAMAVGLVPLPLVAVGAILMWGALAPARDGAPSESPPPQAFAPTTVPQQP